MSVPSAFSGTGLSIQASVPLIRGANVVGNYSGEVNAYSHNISVVGGFVSADFTLVGNMNFVENWLQNGLGRHIQVFSPSLQVVWEGYVNQIEVNMGGVTFVRGPLSNLANRVSVVYTPIFRNEDGEVSDPPETGTPTVTIITEDFISQETYGIWEKVINGGTVLPEEANDMRDFFLSESASPEGFPSISFGGGGSSSGVMNVRVQCRGYIDWMNYIYQYEPDVTESMWASDKIMAVLDADPNQIISRFYDKIDFNGVLTQNTEASYRAASAIIDDTLALGGPNFERWMFGIYGGRSPVYSGVTSEIEYMFYKTDKSVRIETIQGKYLNPWEIMPGKWAAAPSFLAGFHPHITVNKDDPRVFFVEQVEFTSPDQVNMTGQKMRNFPQYLAQLGLQGG